MYCKMFELKHDTSNAYHSNCPLEMRKLGTVCSKALAFLSPLFSFIDFDVVFKTGLKYLKYSMGLGRGGIHIGGVLCPVAIARIQSTKKVLCGFRLWGKKYGVTLLKA